jgi:hypothetical protein
LRDEAGQAGRLRLRLLRRLRLVLRLAGLRLVLLGQALGVDRLEPLALGLLELRELLVRPLLELRLPDMVPQEEDVALLLRRRHRACLVPSSWWRTKRKRAADDSTSLDSSEGRNRVSSAIEILNERHQQQKQLG